MLLCGPVAHAADAGPAPSPGPSPVPGPAPSARSGSTPAADVTPLCALSDPALAQPTGIAVDGQGNRWVISGSGSSVRVYQLAENCSVRTVLAAAVDPNDLQDLAVARTGALWMADIGDPGHDRATVAMITVGGPGKPSVHRLRYPDGAHDAEAMLLGADGVPLIVTVDPAGPAGVYRPTQPITAAAGTRADDAVPLRKVAELTLPAPTVSGDPAGARTVITGGATTSDGTVAALRTDTDAWLFAAPDGDLAAALTRPPVRIPLPAGQRGGAIAFDPRGDLLAASASSAGGTGGLVEVPAAAALAGASSAPWAAAPGAGESAPGQRSGVSPLRRWLLFGGAAVLLVVALVVVIVGLLAARRRNDPWRSDVSHRRAVHLPGPGRPAPGPPYEGSGPPVWAAGRGWPGGGAYPPPYPPAGGPGAGPSPWEGPLREGPPGTRPAPVRSPMARPPIGQPPAGPAAPPAGPPSTSPDTGGPNRRPTGPWGA